MLRTLLGCALLIWAIQQYRHFEWRLPDRVELGHRRATIEAVPRHLSASRAAGLRVAGAWELSSADPRFGGVSGLAFDGGRLLAITDSGGLVRFAPPAGARRQKLAAELFELPAGPASPDFKRHRDSEAIARDRSGRGWWVAFENYDSLWLFDPRFERVVKAVNLPGVSSGWNRGVEAVAAGPGELLLIRESGDWVVRFDRRGAEARRIANPHGRISDAVRLPSGRILVVLRELTWRGFRNRLATLRPTSDGYTLGPQMAVPGALLDNYEALAVDPSGSRLWLMTDDNFDGRFRTLLVALEMPAD